MGVHTRGRLPLTLTVLLVAAGGIVVLVRSRSGADDDRPRLPVDVGVVEYVIDGDTIDIEIAGVEERVRLIGVNTPEVHVEGGSPECYGPEAMAFTRAQLPIGTEVRLERDIVGRDDYGRLLAYVFRRDDDTFVNEMLVANGFARPLTIRPNDAYHDRLVDAANEAEDAKVGLWRDCAG